MYLIEERAKITLIVHTAAQHIIIGTLFTVREGDQKTIVLFNFAISVLFIECALISHTHTAHLIEYNYKPDVY